MNIFDKLEQCHAEVKRLNDGWSEANSVILDLRLQIVELKDDVRLSNAAIARLHEALTEIANIANAHHD